MSLSTVLAAAQIVSALAVALTLIVLLVSIRQNTRAQRLLAVESLTAAIAAINVPAIESPAVGSAVAKAVRDWSAASREERITAHYFLFSFFKLVETAWYQQRAGILERGQWLGWETAIRQYYHSPGVAAAWWPRRRHAYSPEFQTYLDSTRPPEGLGTLGDIFDRETQQA